MRWLVVLGLVGACASSPRELRRPLVTDATPLGMERGEVGRWFRTHGWCFDREVAGTVLVQLCGDAPRPMWAALRFVDRRLVAAAMMVPLQRPRQVTGVPPAPVTYPRFDEGHPGVRQVPRDGPGSYRSGPTSRTVSEAMEVFDALAAELEARYGDPVAHGRAPLTRVWHAPHERVTLVVDHGWVIEQHEPR